MLEMSRFRMGITCFLVFGICSFHSVFPEEQASKEKSHRNLEDSLSPGTGSGLSAYAPNLTLFGDLYYAHSSLDYPDRTRTYGTYIVNDKEFSLNHAVVDLSFESPAFRYGLGFHTGTFVQRNYENEPRELQYIYQAFGGITLLENLWLDVGIFPSHLGGESMISMQNYNYTRSMIADNSPYYESGARLQYQATDSLLLGVYILNGWQNIKDNNKDKAGGLEIVYKWGDRWKLSYGGFAGNEAPDFERRQTRYFGNFVIQGKILDSLEILASYDIGFQKKNYLSWTELLDRPDLWLSDTQKTFYRWEGFSLQFYYHFSEKWKLGLRGEGYFDKNEVIVQTRTPNGYQVYSGSVNLDYKSLEQAMLRLEVKHLDSLDPIFLQEEEDPVRQDTVVIFNFSFLI